MALRVLFALVGAVVITAALLLGMNAVTSVFRHADYHRYYRITDVIARPPDRRPDRPEAREKLPEIPDAGAEAPPPDLSLPQQQIPSPAPDYSDDFAKPEIAAPAPDESPR